MSALIDPDELDEERRNTVRHNTTGAAAMLLSHREVFEVGGVSIAHVKRYDAARGN